MKKLFFIRFLWVILGIFASVMLFTEDPNMVHVNNTVTTLLASVTNFFTFA